MILKILKAGQGDSILIRFLDLNSVPRNLLIDGGNNGYEYKNNLKLELLEIQKLNENIDLLVITHNDQDHIKGIEYLLKDNDIDKNIIKKIWFNSFYPEKENPELSFNNDISFTEACKVQVLIEANGLKRENLICVENYSVYKFYGATFTLLSPFSNDLDKMRKANMKAHPDLDISGSENDYNYTLDELININSNIFIKGDENLDDKLENRTSIAFLFEYNSKSLLFLGDANADVISENLERILEKRAAKKLKINYLKLSHHGSQKSISLKLLNQIDCNNFIISANGKKSNLPNKLTFAKILSREDRGEEEDDFIFNYKDFSNRLNFSQDEKEKFNFRCTDSNFDNGYILNL